jgi:hypothetical protein
MSALLLAGEVRDAEACEPPVAGDTLVYVQHLMLTRVEWSLLQLAAARGRWFMVDEWRREDVGSMSALAMALRRRGLHVTIRKEDDGMSRAFAMMPL